LKEFEADAFTKFLLPMLAYFPDKRATAQDSLRNLWLKMQRNLDFRMPEQELMQYFQKKKWRQMDELNLESHEAEDSDNQDADSEDNDYEDEESGDEDRERGENNFYIPSRYAIDRSFYNGGYIGYGDGIKLDELDHTANWQFDEFDKSQ
jgi:hypothetical protein